MASEETREQAAKSKADTEAAVARAAAKTTPRKGSIIVTANVDGGRRRGGFGFSRTPMTIALAEIDGDQIEAIEADPTLSVKYAD